MVSLGGGCGCCFASAYGISNATVGQKEQLSQAIRQTLEEFRALGRGSCCIGGDFNAEEQELSEVSELRRAGWADWGSEPTCITAATKWPKRIDQAWLSPDTQARLVEVQLSWSETLQTHAWQQRPGGPVPAMATPGPAEGEEGFLDVEFWALFAGVGEAWEAARLRGDVDGMW